VYTYYRYTDTRIYQMYLYISLQTYVQTDRAGYVIYSSNDRDIRI